MNVHRVNYGKVGLMMMWGASVCDQVQIVPSNCVAPVPAANPVIPTNVINPTVATNVAGAMCQPDFASAGSNFTGGSCRSTPNMSKNYGKASPLSDMIFPTSTCNYYDPYQNKNTSVDKNKSSRLEPSSNTFRNSGSEKASAAGTDLYGKSLNMRDIKQVLSDRISKTNTATGIVIPGGLRRDFHDRPLEKAKKNESGNIITGRVYVSDGNGGNTAPKRKNFQDDAFGEVGADRKSDFPDRDGKTITGKIFFDLPRKGAPPPCSRVLVDEFQSGSLDTDSVSEDYQGDHYQDEFHDQNEFHHEKCHEKCKQHKDHNDEKNIFIQYSDREDAGYLNRLDENDVENNKYPNDEYNRECNKFCDDRLSGVEYEIDTQTIEKKKDEKSNVHFSHDAENDDMFWEIDPMYVNDRNETMFKLYSNSSDGKNKGSEIATRPCQDKNGCLMQGPPYEQDDDHEPTGQRKRVSWSHQNNIRLIHSGSGEALARELKIDFENRVNRELLSLTNRFGENFSCSYSLYHNHVDLEKHTDFYLSLDGKEANDVNSHSLKLENIPAFGHIQCKFYSFIGKKKNQSIVYHSFTEYDLWSFKTRDGVFMIYPFLQKEKIEKVNILNDIDMYHSETCSGPRGISVSDGSSSLSDPQETFSDTVIFSVDPSVRCTICIFVLHGELFIKVRFEKSFNKFFATNYAKIQINKFDSGSKDM